MYPDDIYRVNPDEIIFTVCSDKIIFTVSLDKIIFTVCSDEIIFTVCSDEMIFTVCSDETDTPRFDPDSSQSNCALKPAVVAGKPSLHHTSADYHTTTLQALQENPVKTTQVLTITLPHCRTVAGRSSSNHTTQCWLSLKLNACLICTGWRISTSFDTQPCGIWIWMGPVQQLSTYVELLKVDCIDKSCTTHLLT